MRPRAICSNAPEIPAHTINTIADATAPTLPEYTSSEYMLRVIDGAIIDTMIIASVSSAIYTNSHAGILFRMYAAKSRTPSFLAGNGR